MRIVIPNSTDETHIDITKQKHQDAYMRTTLTLEDDLARRLVDLARESRRPFKAIVNEALRRGLGELTGSEAEFHLQPHAGYLHGGIDDRRFNELAWKLDQESLTRTSSDREP